MHSICSLRGAPTRDNCGGVVSGMKKWLGKGLQSEASSDDVVSRTTVVEEGSN